MVPLAVEGKKDTAEHIDHCEQSKAELATGSESQIISSTDQARPWRAAGNTIANERAITADLEVIGGAHPAFQGQGWREKIQERGR